MRLWFPLGWYVLIFTRFFDSYLILTIWDRSFGSNCGVHASLIAKKIVGTRTEILYKQPINKLISLIQEKELNETEMQLSILIYHVSFFRFFEAGGQGRVSNDFDLPLQFPVISFLSFGKRLCMKNKKEEDLDKKPLSKLAVDACDTSVDGNKHLKRRRNKIEAPMCEKNISFERSSS